MSRFRKMRGWQIFVVLTVTAVLPSDAATAMQSQSQRNQLCQIMQPCLPPLLYASGPFLAKPVIIPVTLREVQSICGDGARAFLGDRVNTAATPFSIFGCAELGPTACVVHVPKDVKAISADLYDMILQHELGHCRGWRHGS